MLGWFEWIERVDGQLKAIDQKLDMISGTISGKIDTVIQNQEKTMALVQVDYAQITQLVSEVATLKTDTTTALADIAAKLAGISGTADPATATAIQGVLTDISTLDANVKAADPGAAVTPSPAA